MNFNIDKNYAQNRSYQNKGVKEIINSLLQTPFGIHQIVVYPNNYKILREAYYYYIKELLEDYNEIVIFLTHYESVSTVRNTLSSFLTNTTNSTNSNSNHVDENNKNNNEIQHNIDIDKYIDNGSLIIIDSKNTFSHIKMEKEYQLTSTLTKKCIIDKNNNKPSSTNNNSLISLVRMTVSHAKKLKKEGITILADYGSLYKKHGFTHLLELEKSIPYTFESINLKQICLYNQKDFFDIFTKQQKKEILDLHSRSIIMVE